MPHALLLSPDDQAVTAITGVLEEMSVTCERPLDGPSAAKKLNSQSFDLVLVDCENLPAAKLIFDVCRRPGTGVNPVPIAIVDGRAGLPTAFRLGAELILTKPVAKDQARTTIRTAVNRVKRDEPVRVTHPLEEPAQETAAPPIPEVRAHAAVAATSAGTQTTEVAPIPVLPNPVIEVGEPPAAQATSVTEEIARPTVQPKLIPALARDLTPPQSFAPPPKPEPPAPPPAPKPSEDPVLADLEADIPTPALTALQEAQPKKGSGSLLLLLFLMLAGGGFYAAWMYQPGFREMVQPWVNRAIGALHVPGQKSVPAPPQHTTSPAPPAETKIAPAITNPAPTAGGENTAPASTPESSAGTKAPTPEASASPTQSTPSAAESSDKSAVQQDTSEGSASSGNADSAKKKVVAAVPTDVELPGEKSAVILSSQGAEKRLIHHVSPAYPAEARRERIEGTVVLKALVSDDGKVVGVRVVEGNPTLASAAITAVKQWRYRPFLRNGKAISFQTIVLVDFQRQ